MIDFTCRVCGSTSYKYDLDYYECKGCGILFKDVEKFSLPEVKFKQLSAHSLPPKKAHNGDVAFDLFSAEGDIIPPFTTHLIMTDISIELPENHEAQIRARSGMAKKGIIVANGPGTIDTNYRGNIGILLYNSTDKDYKIEKHDRIAQMLIMPKLPFTLTEVGILSETERGENGFGSSGK